MEEVRHAVSLLDRHRLLIAQSTSTYPCPPDDLNLRVIHTLRAEFDCPIGYSGHETGLQTTARRCRWARRSSSGTSRWIARCGAPIRPRRWNPAG